MLVFLSMTKDKPRIFLCDIDGTLTDGFKPLTSNGIETKNFYIPDGMGLILLQKLGVQTGIITSEVGPIVIERAKQLRVHYFKSGSKNKLKAAQEISHDSGISLSEMFFIGDDVNDYDLLTQVGFAACPGDAQPIVRAIPGIRVAKAFGGRGAVREMINEIYGEMALLEAWRAEGN